MTSWLGAWVFIFNTNRHLATYKIKPYLTVRTEEVRMANHDEAEDSGHSTKLETVSKNVKLSV
jgi:hypothetical protein